MTELRKPTRRFDWLVPVWALLFCAWLFGVPVLVAESVLSVPFIGVADDDALARRDSLLMWAEIAAVGLPLVGVALAAIARWKTPAIVFGIALLLSSMVVGYAKVSEANQHRGPAPVNDHSICQERSGGGNECPGD